MRRLEEAHATRLACRDVYLRLLTRLSLRSPRGPGVQSSSLWLVGPLYNGRVAALSCVRGYGCQRVWRIMVSPTHGTPFPSRPLHAWLVWCWPACVRSVYCWVVFSAAVWLVHGCVSRRMVGLCVVQSIALSLLSSRLVLRFVVAGYSHVAVIVLRPGCARRFVFVRHRRGRQYSACPGLCGGPYGPGRLRLVAVGRPLRRLFPVRRVLLWLVRFWRVCV